MTRTELIRYLKDIIHLLERGCTNHGCCIKPPRGLGTNGICTCGPFHIMRRLEDAVAHLECMPNRRSWPEEDKR